MKRRVLFVVLPYLVQTDATGAKIRSYHAFPYGVLSIATYIKGVADSRVLDLNGKAAWQELFRDALIDFRPDLVAFSMMFDNSYQYLRPLLEKTKDWDRTLLTVLGGAAASYSFYDILSEQPDLDAICFSEGEIPMRDLLCSNRFDPPSWVTRISGQLAAASLVPNLDDVIDIDYSFVDTERYAMRQAFSPLVDHGHDDARQFFVQTSRGCPFACTFCSNARIHGKKVRYASVDRIIAHVRHLKEDLGMEVLTIYDDQILLNKDRAKDLFRQLAQFNVRIEMPNGVSVAFLDEELCHLMRRAGVDTVYLAIENGSEYVLEKLIKKPLKLHQVKPAVEMLRKEGFWIHGFFVMGMPGEASEHRKETMAFLRDIDLDWVGLNMATPVRGSALYDQCIENGWIEKQKIEDIVDKKYIIRQPGIDPEAVEREVYMMNLEINFVNNYRMRIRDYETAEKCFLDVLQRYNNHAFACYYLSRCSRDYWDKGYYIDQFEKIVAADPVWRGYAEHFNLLPRRHS